jgi:hypothetical protein
MTLKRFCKTMAIRHLLSINPFKVFKNLIIMITDLQALNPRIFKFKTYLIIILIQIITIQKIFMIITVLPIIYSKKKILPYLYKKKQVKLIALIFSGTKKKIRLSQTSYKCLKRTNKVIKRPK